MREAMKRPKCKADDCGELVDEERARNAFSRGQEPYHSDACKERINKRNKRAKRKALAEA